MATKLVSPTNFDNRINKKKDDVLKVVDYFASWCGPCQEIAPDYQALAKENNDIQFFKVDVDQLEDVSARHEVSALPTFVFYLNGDEVGRVVGADLEELRDTVEELKKVSL